MEGYVNGMLYTTEPLSEMESLRSLPSVGFRPGQLAYTPLNNLIATKAPISPNLLPDPNTCKFSRYKAPFTGINLRHSH